MLSIVDPSLRLKVLQFQKIRKLSSFIATIIIIIGTIIILTIIITTIMIIIGLSAKIGFVLRFYSVFENGQWKVKVFQMSYSDLINFIWKKKIKSFEQWHTHTVCWRHLPTTTFPIFQESYRILDRNEIQKSRCQISTAYISISIHEPLHL